MTTISVTEARKNLYELVDEVASSGKRVGITNKGETKAVLVSAEEVASWEATIDVMSDPKLMESIRKGDEDIKAGRVIPWEDVKKELGLDVPDKVIKSSQKRSQKSS
jgi:antitoxin YefM